MADFFGLFWTAWVASFRKELILKAFSATGIWPKNRIEILKRYTKKKPNDSPELKETIDNDWIRIERVLRAAVGGAASNEGKKLSAEVHHLAVQNQLINLENQGLREALANQSKRSKKKKVLDVQQRKEYWGGAFFSSPRKVAEAQWRERIKARDKEGERLRKQTAKELRESNRLLNIKLKEQRAERGAKRRADAAEKKAQKEAERARKAEERNTKKPFTTTQLGKCKASQSLALKAKRVRRSGVVAEGAMGGEASHDAPARRSTLGRTIKPTRKYK
jgi:regulator of replication initiation timing